MDAPECFRKATTWQTVGNVLFWANVAVSFSLIFAKNTKFENILSIPLGAMVVTSLLVSLRSRYLINDGNATLRTVQIADALGAASEHPIREGYYNSSLAPGFRRLLATTCESAGLTKVILEEMFTGHLFKMAVFAVVFVAYVSYAKADASILAVSAQALFSAELLGGLVCLQRYLRKVRGVEQALVQFFRTASDINDPEALAIGIASHVDYECAKEESAILLDSRIFRKLNPRYSEKWNRLRAEFKIDSQTS